MRICILGAGNIGRTLGGIWASQGHKVVFGVRDPLADKSQALLTKYAQGAEVATVLDAPATADVVLFAVPSSVMPETVARTAPLLNGKILIDATNDVAGTPMHQLELLRQAAPDSSLFRAFSNLGWENFADPIIGGVRADLFYCGDRGSVQAVVHDLIDQVGLRPVCLGDTRQAALVDALTRLWFNLALEQGFGRHLAFKLLTD